MFMLIFADFEEKCYYQKFSNEQDMNKFIDDYKNEIIVLGNKILN